MSAWKLPTSCMVCGQEYPVRSDFRAVLDALAALNDNSLQETERHACFLRILYPTWQQLPDLNAAMEAALVFVNLGQPIPPNQPPKPQLVDWEKDVHLIAPAVDAVLGFSCRRCAYLHWWEFIGAYYCIGDGVFAQVVSIRSKKAKGQKLEKYEQEFLRENPELFQKASRLTKAEEDFLKNMGLEV